MLAHRLLYKSVSEVIMLYLGGSGYRLSRGESYEILDMANFRCLIVDDNGTKIWVDDCFFK